MKYLRETTNAHSLVCSLQWAWEMSELQIRIFVVAHFTCEFAPACIQFHFEIDTYRDWISLVPMQTLKNGIFVKSYEFLERKTWQHTTIQTDEIWWWRRRKKKERITRRTIKSYKFILCVSNGHILFLIESHRQWLALNFITHKKEEKKSAAFLMFRALNITNAIIWITNCVPHSKSILRNQ